MHIKVKQINQKEADWSKLVIRMQKFLTHVMSSSYDDASYAVFSHPLPPSSDSNHGADGQRQSLHLLSPNI